MARLALVIGLFAGLLCAPALAQEISEADAIARAEERGRLMYAYDQAAWVTTDELQTMISDPRAVGMNGWVVEPDGDALVVTYVARRDDQFSALYRARVRGREILSSALLGEAEDKTLTGQQLAMLRARDAAGAQAPSPCTPAPFNSIVLPPNEAGEIEVYLMSAWVETPLFPLGGHHLYRVNSAGEIVSQRAFTNSCITIDARRGQQQALMVTHLLDPTPTEAHVFLSLTFRLPIYVGIGQPTRIWQVAGDDIEEVDMSGAERKT